MNEIKTPKKPVMFYYGIFLAVIILFNAIVMPLLNNMRVKEVSDDPNDDPENYQLTCMQRIWMFFLLQKMIKSFQSLKKK